MTQLIDPSRYMKNLGNNPRYSLDFSLRDTNQAVAYFIRPEPTDSGIKKETDHEPARKIFIPGAAHGRIAFIGTC
ncbi:MAG TPA: hypothetical protein ENI83_02260, partial [Gammaproteobacteria bacterium]|nr:hypothetical protein [Gammaproteobacteria bacterium]